MYRYVCFILEIKDTKCTDMSASYLDIQRQCGSVKNGTLLQKRLRVSHFSDCELSIYM